MTDAVTVLTSVKEAEIMDAFIITNLNVFAIDTLWKHTEAQSRLVMDSVIIPTLVEIDLIVDFEYILFDNDTIWKQGVAHNRLVIDAVTILKLRA